MRVAIGALHGGLAVEIDSHDPRQTHLGGEAVDQLTQPVRVINGRSHGEQAVTLQRLGRRATKRILLNGKKHGSWSPISLISSCS